MGSLPLFSKVGKSGCEWKSRMLNLTDSLGKCASQAEDFGKEFTWKYKRWNLSLLSYPCLQTFRRVILFPQVSWTTNQIRPLSMLNFSVFPTETGWATLGSYLICLTSLLPFSSFISLFSAHPYPYQPNYHVLNTALLFHPSIPLLIYHSSLA